MRSSMIKHIIFDFNGTIINDVELCLDLLNEILVGQGKTPVSLERYREVFKFPIKQYYIDAGVDFNIESFESLADKFIKKYQPKSFSCGLYDGTVETIKYLRAKGIKTYILSASERNNLLEQCEKYNICNLFDAILGIDDIHARGKVDIAVEYMKKANINPDEVLFIGDTLHDYEVSRAINCQCYLVSCGHQSIDILRKANVKILSKISDLRDIF